MGLRQQAVAWEPHKRELTGYLRQTVSARTERDLQNRRSESCRLLDRVLALTVRQAGGDKLLVEIGRHAYEDDGVPVPPGQRKRRGDVVDQEHANESDDEEEADEPVG